jgi:hypothetical protein
MTQSTWAENLNDRLGFGRVVQSASSHRPRRRLGFIEHGGEGDATEPAAEFPEEIAAPDHALATIAKVG